MKQPSIASIIHIFALLHAAAALLCNYLGAEDEIILTLLTMLMALLICRKKSLNIELTAASIVVANIIGYVMGSLGANLLFQFLSSSPLIHAISTTVTTEILGWSMVGLAKLFNAEINSSQSSDYQLKWALLAIGGVLAVRLIITLLFSHSSIESEKMISAVIGVYSNSLVLISLFCVNIIYIWYNDRLTKGLSKFSKSLLLVIFYTVATVATSFIIYWMTSSDTSIKYDFTSLLVTTLLAQTVIYCIVWMTHYALTSKKKIQR